MLSYDETIAVRRMVADHYAKHRFERARIVDEARKRRQSRRQAGAPAGREDRDADHA